MIVSGLYMYMQCNKLVYTCVRVRVLYESIVNFTSRCTWACCIHVCIFMLVNVYIYLYVCTSANMECLSSMFLERK